MGHAHQLGHSISVVRPPPHRPTSYAAQHATHNPSHSSHHHPGQCQPPNAYRQSHAATWHSRLLPPHDTTTPPAPAPPAPAPGSYSTSFSYASTCSGGRGDAHVVELRLLHHTAVTQLGPGGGETGVGGVGGVGGSGAGAWARVANGVTATCRRGAEGRGSVRAVTRQSLGSTGGRGRRLKEARVLYMREPNKHAQN